MPRVQSRGQAQATAQTKNERIGIRALIFFPAKREVFIRSAVAQNFPPVHALDERFQFVGTHSGGIKPAYQAAHTGSGNVVHGDVVFLEPLQHANVRKTHGAAAFQCHADFRARARCGVLLRPQCAGQQKQQKNENHSAHAGLLRDSSKLLNSRMNYEFGAARRFQQARKEAQETFFSCRILPPSITKICPVM